MPTRRIKRWPSIDPRIGELLGLAAPAPATRSASEAQALMSGLLQGLGQN
jgi:hypothetical protein